MKEFLSQKGITWTEKMVDQDRAAAIEMIRRSGQQGVPVTVIGDDVVVGFDKPRLERIVAAIAANSVKPTQAQTSPGDRRSLGAKVADAGRYALPGGASVAGAYIGGIHAGSPAEAAGLRIGDVIVAVGGAPVASVEDLTLALSKHGPGAVPLTVMRGANRRDVTVEL